MAKKKKKAKSDTKPKLEGGDLESPEATGAVEVMVDWEDAKKELADVDATDSSEVMVGLNSDTPVDAEVHIDGIKINADNGISEDKGSAILDAAEILCSMAVNYYLEVKGGKQALKMAAKMYGELANKE